MKWTDEQVNRLKSLCRSGKTNRQLAEIFDVNIDEIYAKRSQLRYTVKDVEAEKAAERLLR